MYTKQESLFVFKMEKKISIYLGLLFLLTACYKPVVLDLPEFNSQPVVNCFFTAGEPFRVFVSKTASQFDSVLVNVEDARVEILRNEQVLAVLPYVADSVYSDTTFFPKPGILYTIRVEVPGYPVVSASDSIPSSFSEFTYLGYKERAWYSEEGSRYDGLSFRIDDVPGPNYFHVRYRSTSYSYNKPLDSMVFSLWQSVLFCFDPVVKEQNTDEVFSDRAFDGQSIELQLMNQNLRFLADDDSINFLVHVMQGSPAFYRYIMVYDQHRAAQYSDFFNPMEPVIMYSNIENGYGIFAGYHSKFYPVNLKTKLP
jgi:hypothetical protein